MPAPEVLLAIGLLAVSLLEVMPPLGRFIPGQLLVGTLAATAVGIGHFTPWHLVAVLAGSLAGDALNFARAKHHPRFLMGGGWWLPGQDVDRLEANLRRDPARTFLLRRFSTKDRALLPLAAGGWGMGWGSFLLAALPACAAWSLAWTGIGALIAFAFLYLPPAIGIALLLGALMIATKPADEARPA